MRADAPSVGHRGPCGKILDCFATPAIATNDRRAPHGSLSHRRATIHSATSERLNLRARDERLNSFSLSKQPSRSQSSITPRNIPPVKPNNYLGRRMNRLWIGGYAALFGLACFLPATGYAQQEVKQDAVGPVGTANVTPVTQAMLNAADKNASQFSADQRELCADPVSPGQADQPEEREEPARRLDLPDRRQGIAGDLAHRGRRRDVRDHLLQPRLCARRQDRPRALALQSQDGTNHDLLLRPEQSRRPGPQRPRSISRRSMQS